LSFILLNIRIIYLKLVLGLSGFIPSIVALLQGVGENNDCSHDNNTLNGNLNGTIKATVIEPRFSVEVFFTSLLFTLLISWIAFILLQFLPICKKEMRNLNKNISKNAEDLDKNNMKNAAELLLY